MWEYSCEKVAGGSYRICDCGSCATRCYDVQTVDGGCGYGWYIQR
jgi:hypothetical protein